MKIRLKETFTGQNFISTSAVSFTTHSLVSGILNFSAGGIDSGFGTCGGGNVNCGFVYDSFDPYFIPHSTFTSAAFDTGFSTPVYGQNFVITHTSDTESAAYYYVQSATSSSGEWRPRVSQTPNARWASPPLRYNRLQGVFEVTVSSKGPSIQDMTLDATTTGYWTSPTRFIGTAITSWRQLDISESRPTGSTITYQVRSATYSFPTDNAGLAWTTMNAGETIPLTVVAPQTYLQERFLLAPSFPSAIPEVLLSRANWQEGDDIPLASGFINHRYFLCAAISSTAVINDTCLVQQRGGDWVRFTGLTAAALTLFDNELVGGSGSSDGEVWRLLQDDVYNDNGTAIDAYWVSPDMIFGNPVAEKVLTEIWIDAAPSTGTLLSVGYAVNRSTGFVSRDLDLGTSATAINRRAPITSGFSASKYHRLRLRNAQNDKYFRVNALTIFGEHKQRTD
jgi:hypothetical protein